MKFVNCETHERVNAKAHIVIHPIYLFWLKRTFTPPTQLSHQTHAYSEPPPKKDKIGDMPALLRSALSRMAKNYSSPSSSPASTTSSSSSSSGRKSLGGGTATRSLRRSLSVRATQVLDDGDTSDGQAIHDVYGSSRRQRQRFRQRQRQQPPNENADDDDDNDDDDVDVDPHSSTPFDESPVVKRKQAKSLVNVLVNDDCVGIVVEDDDDDDDDDYGDDDYAAGAPEMEGREGIDQGHNEDDDDLDDGGDDDDDDIDEIARAGNEALLLVYGHNANLYTDVFQLPPSGDRSNIPPGHPHDLESMIEKSYEELTEQLTLALACGDYQREAAVVCGYNNRSARDMDPVTYLEVKRDALRRAREILLDDDCRREYDEMLRKYGDETRKSRSFGGGREVGGTLSNVEIASGAIDGNPPSAGTDDEEGREMGHLDVEEHEGGDTEYGSHGDYSYDSDDTGYSGLESPQEKEDTDTAKPRQKHHSTADQNESDLLMNGRKHHSPSDQNEFDLLVSDSLDREEFFNQLPPSKQGPSSPPVIPRLKYPPRSPRQQQQCRRQKNANLDHKDFDYGKDKTERKKGEYRDQDGIKDMDDFIFDPFNLMSDADINPFRIKDKELKEGDTIYTREDDRVKESLSFVCPLPSREEEEEDDDEISEILKQLEEDGNDFARSSKTNGSTVFGNVDIGVYDSLSVEKPGPKKKNEKGQQHPQGGLGSTDYNYFSFSLSESDDDPEELVLTPNNTKNENARRDGGGRGIALDCSDSHENSIKKSQGGDVCVIETRNNQDPTLEAFRNYSVLFDNTSASTVSRDKKSKTNRQGMVKVKLRDLVRSLRVGSKSKGSLGSSSLSTEEKSEREEEEVRRMLMIASTFTNLNAASKEKELQEHDILDDYDNDSFSSHSSSSFYSEEKEESDEEEEEEEEDEEIASRLMKAMRCMSKGSEEIDEIDCFPAEVDDQHSVRFNVEDEEFEYNSDESVSGGRNGGTPIGRKPEFLPFMDVFFDSMCKTADDAISAAETFFWIPDETAD